jgi:integrase
MAKTLSESPLTTRNARAALPVGVHWRRIDPETHLGYRKRTRSGVWLVRWRHGKGYRQAPLGTADDALKAGTLSFEAATKAARDHVEKVRANALTEAAGPILTVRSAVDAYIAERDVRDSRRAGREKRSDAASRLRRYVTGRAAEGRRQPIAAAPIAAVELHALTEKDLARWRDSLPADLKATTKRRLVNDFKAALNLAYAHDRERLPAALPGIIKHALRTVARDDETEPVARDSQILSDAEMSRILAAAREVDAADGWEGDLFRLVLVLAATGARFSQTARLRVRDFQAKECRLLVPVSRKGRGGAKGHAVTVPIGADVVAALAPVAARRPADALLLERWRAIQKPGSVEWHRDRRGAWQSSAELVRPWQSIRERAGLPDVVAYSLRHSSIVRAIRSNLPLRLVAALHDTSTAMIERHYAKWITGGLEEMARAAIMPLVPDDKVKVIRRPERTKA